jgi:nucleoside phosphorylase
MINDGKGPGGSTLLCFAHKGEAQSFFQYYSFQPHQRFHDVWVAPELTLCLTGEGIDQAMTKTALLLGAHPEINQIFNLGVAGAIRPEVELHQIIHVRSVYGEDRFHSYELDGDVDLLTTHDRLLDDKKAQKLRALAPVVDRELWAIARVSKEAKVSLQALKIISDIVGEDQKEICAVVKEQAAFYSEQLLEAYLQKVSHNSPTIINTDELPSLFQNELFHFSKVQQRQVLRLLDQLKNQHPLLEELTFNLGQIKRRPKDRARLLIEELNKILFPLEFHIKEALRSCAKDDLKLGIEVQYDSQLEDLALQIKLKAENKHQWQQSMRALETLDLERYWQILRGELDV